MHFSARCGAKLPVTACPSETARSASGRALDLTQRDASSLAELAFFVVLY